jgi:HSP20 family protein
MTKPETLTKTPVSNEEKPAASGASMFAWHPVESLRREVDRLFEDFNHGAWHLPSRRWPFDIEPAWHRLSSLKIVPAVDIAEKEKTFEICAELPGMQQRDVEVSIANGVLRIKGEKKEQVEEKKKDYYLSERRYGSFERSFQVPDAVDVDRIEASFANGVLKMTLPKSAEAQKKEKKIEVKSA